MSVAIPQNPLAGVAAKRPGGRLVLVGVMFAVWLAIVVFTVSHHEYFRDEVRPLVLALSARHFWTVPAAIQGAEGHPALWYILLRICHDIFGMSVVLPLLSVTVAAASMLLLLIRSPFPLWWSGLFLFSGLPIYEYSVMARNYGIAMLLIFVFCVLMTRPKRQDVSIGIVLFLISQTNVPAAMMVPFLSLIQIEAWWWERNAPKSDGAGLWKISIGTGLAVLGIVAAFSTVYPPHDDLVFQSQTQNDWHRSYFRTLFAVVTQPGHFYRLITHVQTLLSSGFLFLAALGLIRRPLLFGAAIGGLWVTSAFFALVYDGHYRHEGIYLVFLIALYWIMLGDPERRPTPAWPDLKSWPLLCAFYVILPVIFVLNWGVGIQNIQNDYSHEMSKSEALGALIRTSPKLQNAIIVAEPDAWKEAIPYYASNDMYSVRGSEFSKVAHWSHHELHDISLGLVLSESRKLHASTGRPIIILIQFPLTIESAGKPLDGSFGQHFEYSEQELRDFQAATTPLPLGPPAIAEDFNAYLLE